MKSRQVGFVLIALIAVGIAGLIARVASSGSDELTLSGLLPLAPDVVTKATIRSNESEVELVRVGDSWRAGSYPAFSAMVEQFWTAVADMDGAQLVATNPDNHERIGVKKGQGTVVSFYLGPAIQEQFIVGKWTSDVRLCYIRRSGKNDVYGIPCLRPDVFAARTDNWRNPLIVAIPTDEVESITFTYPGEEFVLETRGGEWVVTSGEQEQPADLWTVRDALTALEVLVAMGFADDEETKGIDIAAPDASLRVVTRTGASAPTTRLRFFERGDGSFYVTTPAQATVFVLDEATADALLKASADFVQESEE